MLFWNGASTDGEKAAQNNCLKLLLEAGADPNVHFKSRRFDYGKGGYALEVKVFSNSIQSVCVRVTTKLLIFEVVLPCRLLEKRTWKS